jgi:hypothetical protein
MNFLELISELKQLNVKVTLAGDKLRLDAPAGVLTPALKEAITKHKDELVNHLTQWSEPAALGQFRAALDRIRRRFPPDAICWTKSNHPELWQAVLDKQEEFDQMFHGQDMDGCRRAAAGYERAFNELIDAYNQKRVLTTEEAIKAFGCDRVWGLPPGKVVVLDAVFQKEGVRWD